MNLLDTKDALLAIKLDLSGLSSTFLLLAEAQNVYDLSAQLEMFSHVLSHAAEQLESIVNDM